MKKYLPTILAIVVFCILWLSWAIVRVLLNISLKRPGFWDYLWFGIMFAAFTASKRLFNNILFKKDKQ